jgi:hypothetical protein
MAAPSRADLTRLLRWRPRHGVVSVYLDLAPGDRGEAWRIELRNGLRSAADTVREGGERGARIAVEEAIERIEGRFAEGGRPGGRAQVGFVEAGDRGGERWYSLALPVGGTEVAHASRPVLRPLLAALDDGAPRGVFAASSEHIRLLGWAMGELDEIDSWSLEIFSGDWRERKSRGSADPARAQGTTASGRDQFGQRMDANRERFLRESGRLAAQRASGRGWQEIDVFAEEHQFQLLAAGLGDGIPIRHVDDHNVISQPTHAIAERLEELLPGLNRERERTLLQRVRGEAHGGTRGALGLEETLQALLEGRVEHLLIDPERSYALPPGSPLTDAAERELPLGERLVDLALSTRASITPLEGNAAEELAEHGGVAALLRY